MKTDFDKTNLPDIDVLLREPRCAVCKRPLRYDNTTGYCKRHYSASPQKKAYLTEYQREHREAISKRAAAWRRTHKDELKAKAAARIEKAIRDVVLIEREACARLAENFCPAQGETVNTEKHEIAKLIRNRK